MNATPNRIAAGVLLAGFVVALLGFGYVVRQMSLVSVALAAHDEVETQLRLALEDQKKLARLDPSSSSKYHRRFDSIATLLGRLRIVQFNRSFLTRNIEDVLIAAVAVILAGGTALYLLERRSRERRLVRLESAVAALSRGEGEIVLGETRHDAIGRIAAAVESSSRQAVQDRRRIRYLEHLSAWQEAARRHAHEIRTPLAAAGMEVERFTSRMRLLVPGSAAEIDEARKSVMEELDHLRTFTRNFTSFASIAPPRPRPLDLADFLAKFCESFATAWPNVELRCLPGPALAVVEADGDLLRQVLVNLANNACLAFEGRRGSIEMRLTRSGSSYLVDVADDGPGVAPSIRSRLFEPYTTTRGVGEGMGLGLAISKKIMLDHGGDLDLVDSAKGALFRLTLPVREAGA